MAIIIGRFLQQPPPPTTTRAATALLTFATALFLGVIAFHNLRGDISAQPLRVPTKSSSKFMSFSTRPTGPLARLHTNNVAKKTSNNNNDGNNE